MTQLKKKAKLEFRDRNMAGGFDRNEKTRIIVVTFKPVGGTKRAHLRYYDNCNTARLTALDMDTMPKEIHEEFNKLGLTALPRNFTATAFPTAHQVQAKPPSFTAKKQSFPYVKAAVRNRIRKKFANLNKEMLDDDWSLLVATESQRRVKKHVPLLKMLVDTRKWAERVGKSPWKYSGYFLCKVLPCSDDETKTEEEEEDDDNGK
ncbi:hypothetical protein T440DRAFT_479457 [Plenodomus tracheiphilus IPT5]|uniref:Uncharacterized protein n=1 Tax=Plenodomus tracheiphilus IPT5 TaxID=1408161 RepID=A0A6A7B4Z0_9PLEO|nr:hypothetical protein T440DRAFT_479457 [Plenodomus tracheiphilus IPT5]